MRKYFYAHQKGAIIVLFALILPIMLFFMAMAIDMGVLYVYHGKLQDKADAAALACAGGLNSDGTLDSTFKEAVLERYAGKGSDGINATATPSSGKVVVAVTQNIKISFIGAFLGNDDYTISAEATAKIGEYPYLVQTE